VREPEDHATLLAFEFSPVFPVAVHFDLSGKCSNTKYMKHINPILITNISSSIQFKSSPRTFFFIFWIVAAPWLLCSFTLKPAFLTATSKAVKMSLTGYSHLPIRFTPSA
jgi:hypothetical protein